METLEGLRRKIESADDLHTVVRIMKTLAAVSIRQYDRSIRSLRVYSKGVESGLQAALLGRPPVREEEKTGRTAALLFGSDQGMAGRFNELIVDFAGEALTGEDSSARPVIFWAAGAKAAGALEDRFGRVDRSFPLPPSVNAVVGVVREIIISFENLRSTQGPSRFIIFYNEPVSGFAYAQRSVNLLPLDEKWLAAVGAGRWPGRGLPFYRLSWEEMFSSLIGEYIFVELFRALAASLAAENAARLAAMQRAEKNIEELRESLRASYDALRQSSITQELFDVISGYEALSSS